jgi:hypothetical protein
MECPADLHWNVELETCDYPYRAGCDSTLTPTPIGPTTTTTTPAPVDPCPPGEVPKCRFPDGEYSTFFPHPNDCHWFIYCSHGLAYCKECPADLHWNVESETCDYPYRAGCDSTPTPPTSPSIDPTTTTTATAPATPCPPGEFCLLLLVFYYCYY